MSDDNTQSDEYNRRDVLKTTGSASITTTLGIAGLSGQVSAADRKALADTEFEELTGPEAKEVIGSLTRTREWATLARGVESEGWGIKLDDNIVYRATSGDNRRVLASIKVKAESDAEYFRAIIGRDETSGDIIGPSLERRRQTEAGAKVETFRPASGTGTHTSTERTDGAYLEREVFEVSDTASGLQVTQDGEAVTPNGVWCLACKAVVKAACRVGCGAGAGFICGLASVATNFVGGSACVSIAIKVCWVLAHVTSCGVDDSEICCEAGNWCCDSGWS